MAPRPAAAAQAGFEPVTLPKHDAVPVCLAIGQGASPSLYVGTTDGQVFASHDGARSWHGGPLVASVSPLPPRSHLRAAFSVTYAGRIYGEDSVAGQYNGAVTVDGGQVFGFSAAESQFEDPIGSGSGFIQAALLSEIGSGGGTHVVDGSPPPPIGFSRACGARFRSVSSSSRCTRSTRNRLWSAGVTPSLPPWTGATASRAVSSPALGVSAWLRARRALSSTRPPAPASARRASVGPGFRRLQARRLRWSPRPKCPRFEANGTS